MSKPTDADPLAEYLAKRDFSRTPEPTGKGGAGAGPGGRPVFVVQKHKARTLHYDFRLQVGGVLKSWAVPKGPSMSPKDKRLAVAVEDHPLDYAGFEGTIPADSYGAGPVIVWDAGVYRNRSFYRTGPHGSAEKEDGPATMEEAIEAGRVEVVLEGEKLRGGFALVHTRMGGKEKNWLLIKMRDDAADDAGGSSVAADRPDSVLTGRSIEQVAEEET